MTSSNSHDDIVYFQLQIPSYLTLEEKVKIKKLLEEKYSSLTDEYFDCMSKQRNEVRKREGKQCTNDSTIAGNDTDKLSDDEIFFYKEDKVTYCFDYSEIDGLLSFAKNPYTNKPFDSSFIELLNQAKNSKYYGVEIDPIDIAYKKLLGKKVEQVARTVKDDLRQSVEETEKLYKEFFPGLTKYVQFDSFFNEYRLDDYQEFASMFGSSINVGNVGHDNNVGHESNVGHDNNVGREDHSRDSAALQLSVFIKDLFNDRSIEATEKRTVIPLAIDDFIAMKKANMTTIAYNQFLLNTENRESFFRFIVVHDDIYETFLENIRNGHFYEVNLMVQENLVNPREENNYPIRFATDLGLIEFVRVFLEWRGPNGEWIDPRVDNNSALRVANQKGYYDIVTLLLTWAGPNGEYVSM